MALPNQNLSSSYRSTYTWYFQMKEGKVKAIAFFDARDFDEFWTRVSPVI